MTDTYKLYYFEGNGRALVIRAILSYVKASFEDIRIKTEEWPAMKKSGKFEYNQLPCLEYKGKSFSQSHSIEQYLARTFDLYGKNIEDEYQINSLLDSFEDLFTVFHMYIFPSSEEEKSRAEDLKYAFLDKFKFFVGIYEKTYEKIGEKKYFLGDYFSLADIFLCTVLHYFSHIFKCEDMVKATAPKLSKILEELEENQLKEFFDKYFNKESKF